MKPALSKRMSLNNNDKRQLNPNSPTFIPLKYAAVASFGMSANVNNAPPRNGSQVAKLGFSNTCIMKEQVGKHANISEMEITLNKITEAVSDAYRIEMASTGAHLDTGTPLADFETLLHCASPVLDGNLQECHSCFRDISVGSPLTRTEIPDISLGSYWQYYEKLGSYGLEVRAEDPCFCAYFVPFLSAIQLFGNPRKSSCSSGSPSVEVLKASDLKKASQKSSGIAYLPISSVLLKQPRGKNKTSAPSYKLSPVSGEEFSDRSLRTAQINDSELLFEYFESETPFQRRPLCDKIKELVRSDDLEKCQTYGDPEQLESLNLRDLHPGSWYSIAWYPIYRIPEGKLRASFLTYHSLGHYVRKQNLSAGGTSIVFPVVGLQSYNTQGECWFQLKPSLVTQKEETSKYNRTKILRDRLKSLEKTASVMARAVVNKGKEKQRSVNRQSDYEFFLSRKRW